MNLNKDFQTKQQKEIFKTLDKSFWELGVEELFRSFDGFLKPSNKSVLQSTSEAKTQEKVLPNQISQSLDKREDALNEEKKSLQRK